MDGKYSPYGWTGDILVRHSPDFGEHWGPELQVTFDHLALTNGISASDSQVHVTWEDHLTNSILEAEVYYRNSSNHGQTWSPTQRLTYRRGYCSDLDQTQQGDTLHLVWWEDDWVQGSNILYKRGVASHTGQSISENRLTGRSLPSCAGNFTILPNPFNSTTVLTLMLAQSSEISLSIYNIGGEEIVSLHQGQMAPGAHQFVWEGKNSHGISVASGMYLALIKINGRISFYRKVLLLN
jgi:hypothetical protein